MKTNAKKSSTTTSTAVKHAASRPFFAKAGGGNFIAPKKSNGIEKSRKAPAAEEKLQQKSGDGAPGKDASDELRHPAETRQTQALQHSKSQEQTVAARRTSEDSSLVQPGADVTDKRPSENEQNEHGGIALPASQALQVADSGKAQNDGDGSAFLGRIAAAPQSSTKMIAFAQALLINNDCVRSESQVSRIASTRRQQIGANFSGFRLGLSAFFINTIIGVQTFITGKQAEIVAAATRALAWVRTTITGALLAAQALSIRIRARINEMLENITTSVQSRVEGIAGRISGLINSVPLPDIPGIGQIRAAAVNMLNRAVGVVNAAFTRLVDFIGWALNAGMNMLDLFLSGFSRMVGMALSFVSSAIFRALQMIAQALNRATALIVSTLRRVLLGIIVPILNRIEALIKQLILRAEKRALALLRENRHKYLSALAEILTPGAAAKDSKAASTDSQMAAILQLGRDAMQNNRMIVQTFEFLMGGAIIAIVGPMASAVIRLLATIAGLIAQIARRILAAVSLAIQMLSQFIQTIGSFLMELFQTLTEAMQSILASLRSLVQGGVQRLIQFVQNGLQRIGSFIRRFVQNLILGRGVSDSLTDALGAFSIAHGPITRPRPGPITIPGVLIGILIVFAYIGVIIVYAVPELLVIVSVLVSLGLSPMVAFAVFAVIVIIALLLFFLLMYLLLRWLTRPKPPKPPDDPKITHETTFSAPDGSPKTRKDIGVGEEVVFKGSAPGTWSASSGRPTHAAGSTFTWNAPDRTATAKIDLTVGSKSSSVLLDVVEPNAITAIKLSENIYPAGTQGAGMMLNFVFHPLRVSFGNAESREVSGPASAITGYYLLHGMPHDHNAGPVRFFRISQDNKFLSARDQAAQSGYPSPWDKGSFHWVIPNKFKVITESGDGKQYTTVTQAFFMADASGKTKITKAGEKVERTP